MNVSAVCRLLVEDPEGWTTPEVAYNTGNYTYLDHDGVWIRLAIRNFNGEVQVQGVPVGWFGSWRIRRAMAKRLAVRVDAYLNRKPPLTPEEEEAWAEVRRIAG